jgi:hypothetical protein
MLSTDWLKTFRLVPILVILVEKLIIYCLSELVSKYTATKKAKRKEKEVIQDDPKDENIDSVDVVLNRIETNGPFDRGRSRR